MNLTDQDWNSILESFRIANDPDNYVGAALCDLFALGCYLHSIGQTEAGTKTVKTALRATSFVEKNSKTNLFSKVIENLSGNEKEYFDKIAPHVELFGLFETKPELMA